MTSKDLQEKLKEKVRLCCDSAEAYKKHAPLLIEKAQTGQEYGKFCEKTDENH